MADVPKTGLLDLEKELTCSICTDVLYQPLTLLDCLHTFCGSCLKTWFGFAAARPNAAPASSCPSCRAAVRETRPNATVTTLLDMFLNANPSRGKSDQEKEEIARIYKPGDDVLPKPATRDRGRLDPRGRRGRGQRNRDVEAEEEEDRRLIDEVRELSLREMQAPRVSSSEQPQRRMEHQSSLRSLLSVSRRSSGADVDAQAMEEEIMRQIVEENLLEGIDLTNINVEQEEQISDRIVQAYLRQQRDRARGSDRRSTSAQTHEVRSSAAETTHRQRPPVSRPHLFGAANGEPRDRRSSSQGARRNLGPQDTRRASGDTNRTASRSATDLSEQPQTSEARDERARRSSQERRSTDPDRPRISELWQRRTARGIPHIRTPSGDSVPGRERSATNDANRAPSSADPRLGTAPIVSTNRANGGSAPRSASLPLTEHDSGPDATELPTSQQRRAPSFSEPNISCSRCDRPHIEHKLHYRCPTCSSGDYHLCFSCYRLGKGCLHWYGFGHNAWATYRRRAPPGGYNSTQEPPHILQPQRYQPPKKASLTGHTTTSDPSTRLLRGVFCASCSTWANTCYWQCAWCNDGEWGFCGPCTNQGRCCTHPLQALACQLPPPETSTSLALLPIPITTTCNICTSPITPSTPHLHCPTCHAGDYDLHPSCHLSASTATRSDAERLQWRLCPRGHRMQTIGFVDANNEFPQTNDTPPGDIRRVLVEDIVGGWALADAAVEAGTGSPELSWREGDGSVRRLQRRTNPDLTGDGTAPDTGGSAAAAIRAAEAKTRCMALWSWYPSLESEDGGDGEPRRGELEFPRGAEIREVVDVNGDWAEGVYCARRGVFPTVRVRGLT